MSKKTKVKTIKDNLQLRPPVAVILGHVDHGKTSILDYIRQSKVAEKESGGITQHIGAYQIEHNGKKITFIDTPGHEAFSAMRGRGAEVADIAILVIAAEEGLKPQTKEAIKHIQRTKLSAIVAINKIDKKEADPERIKNELADFGFLVETRGGEIPAINVSAKNGQGIDELLGMINLIAEMAELKYDPKQPANGTIIESFQDQRRGPTATLLIKEGTLNQRDIIGTNTAFGRIKTMSDFQLKPIKEAGAATPAVAIGLNQVPQVGEQFFVFSNLNEAEAKVQKMAEKSAPADEQAEVLEIGPDKKVLNIVLKSDVRGSLEAIRESLKNIPSEEVVLRFIKADVGDISESDLKLAEMSQAAVIGFRVKNSSSIQEMAQRKNIRIFTFDIIYELIQQIRESMSNLLEPEIVKNAIGRLKILAVFKTDKSRQIVGGRVTSGQAQRGVKVDIIRNGENIGQGRLVQLQKDKKEASEVSKDQECGLMVETPTAIEKGDSLEFYSEEKKKREI